MPQFTYKAIDNSGRIQEGELQANNVEDLELRLRHMGLDLIKYKDKKPGLFGHIGHSVERKQLITFCFYMKQLVQSGVPMVEGLNDLRNSEAQGYFKDIISTLVEDIQGGQKLSEAMSRYPKVFDTVFVNLVNVGENSGELDVVFEHLMNNLKWQSELIAQTKKILIYPIIVAISIFGSTAFMMIYLVPQLVGFIKSMGHELPLHTKALIATSDIFVHYWYIFLLAPILVVVVLLGGRRLSYTFRYYTDLYKLRLWVIGPVIEKIILARFASFFALMYSSGITVLESLKHSQTFANNLVVEEALQQVHDQISDGMGISDSFAKTRLFKPLVLRMVNVGESTGRLDEALLSVRYFYDSEVQESISKIQAGIGPALTVFMGLIMAWVMFSVLGPMYDIMSDLPV